MGPLAAAASTFKMFGNGPTFARPNRWGGAKARAAVVAGGKKQRVSWVCRECADAFMHEHAEQFTLGMVHQAKHRQCLIEHASASECKNGHEKGTSHLCKWIDVVAALKYRREKAAAMGIAFKSGDSGGTVARAAARDPELARELNLFKKERDAAKKELAQTKKALAIAQGAEPEEDDDEEFWEVGEEEEVTPPPPKINVQQIQAAINRAKSGLRLEKQELEPDEAMVKKYGERIKAYEAQIAEATPPDKRAKEIESKLLAAENFARNKNLASEKNRKEAERLKELADQESKEAQSKSAEIDELKQQLKDIRGELGAQLHLKGAPIINDTAKALVESFPDEPGANEIRAKMQELEASLASYSNGVADHAAKVLRGDVKVAVQGADAIEVDLPSDDDAASDDEMPAYVPVPVPPDGRALTAEEWADYYKKQEAHAVEYKKQAASRKEKRKKSDDKRKALCGKLRAGAASSSDGKHKNIVITLKK